MIDLAILKGSSFVVLGLARSGLATVRALKAAGIDCVVWDDNENSRKAAVEIGAVLADPARIDWSKITALVISPGIPNLLPQPHPVAAAARVAGKPLICDVELLARAQPKAKYVAITGTNGKSTTTALIGHVLRNAGVACEVGGNIGRGALDLAPLGEGGIYVLELSSYQLELLQTFRANVAVWLNITPDHIDRHGDMAGYVAAKTHIFDRQQAGDCAVMGVDDDYSRAMFDRITGRAGVIAVPVALERPIAGGVSFRAGMLIDADGYSVDFSDVVTLPGDHNAQNAACAWAACRRSGSRARRSSRGSGPIPACRTARSASRRRARSSTSTTARPPTPTPRRGHCRRTATSTGSWAAKRRRAAWRRSRPGSTASGMPS